MYRYLKNFSKMLKVYGENTICKMYNKGSIFQGKLGLSRCKKPQNFIEDYLVQLFKNKTEIQRNKVFPQGFLTRLWQS